MKIVVTGTRGIPDIQGGVETHCEELFPRIAALGHDVTIVRRSCYVTDDNRISQYKGVKLKDVFAPRQKSLEAIVHTFLAVLEAKKMGADILHIHAIGPSLMVPFARLLGMKVVTTNHGPDYDRKKWGRFAKMMLKAGERNGACCSTEVIVISKVIEDILLKKYNRRSNLIFNGVTIPQKSTNTDYLQMLGVEPRKYVLAVGRFVKEKGFDLLIDAFGKSQHEGFKLVIAGDADHPDEYSEMLKAKARANGVVLTGFVKGEKLNQLFTNAALFVLPSSHEGLPISLLEAMSYNLDALVSDIPANKLPELDATDFFRCGDAESLSKAITTKLEGGCANRNYDLKNYNWDNIALQTVEVYEKALHEKGFVSNEVIEE